ncbi:hypothetical protein ACJIZ3_020107 [Penstemon smallii]|uniref:HMA domain-containing protein n=1 Tax=Penstemon smallii TaxID=265156 RepID=A0ABD3SHV5_9LAMI
MSMVKWEKDELLPMTGTKGGRYPPRTTLAAIESLAMPLVQEVVFMADFRCARCQQRVAQIMSKMNGETQSVMISVLEKKVTLTLTCTNPITSHRQQVSSSWSKVSLVLRLFRASCS